MLWCACEYFKFHCNQALRLSQTALGETAPGKVINLLSNDVSRFESVSLCINALWIAPLLSFIVACLLWQEIGVAGLIGILVITIVMPIQSVFKSHWLTKIIIQSMKIHLIYFRLHWKIIVNISPKNSTANRSTHTIHGWNNIGRTSDKDVCLGQWKTMSSLVQIQIHLI